MQFHCYLRATLIIEIVKVRKNALGKQIDSNCLQLLARAKILTMMSLYLKTQSNSIIMNS